MSHRLLNVQTLSMKNINWTGLQGETINTRSKEQALKDPRTQNPSTPMTTIQAISANAMSLTDIQLCLVRGCHAHQRCYL